MNVEIVAVLAVIFAIAATVVAFVMVVPEKKRDKLGKFGQFLHDTVNFKYLIVEKVLQALYIFLTAYVIIVGFLMLFSVQKSFFGDDVWMGGTGLLLMIVGPIAVRLVYEMSMMLVLLVKNVIQINSKLKAEHDDEAQDLFKAPSIPRVPFAPTATVAPTAPAAPAPVFCKDCGAKLAEDGTCPNGHSL